MANKKKKKNSNKTVAAKKVSKTKKKMSPEAKEKLKTSFLTLVNNDACIRASREYHGWGWNALAVTLAVASCVIAVVPSLVGRLQVDYGNSVLSSPNYSYDDGLTNFTKKLAEEGIDLIIDNNGHPSFGSTESAWIEKMAAKGNETDKLYFYKDVSSSKGQTMFEVFVNPTVFVTTAAHADVTDTTFFADIVEGKNPINHTTRSDRIEGSDAPYATSFLAFGLDSIMIGRYNASGKGERLTGENKALVGTNFKSFAFNRDNQMLQNSELKEAVVANYKNVFRSMTQAQKEAGAWQYTGIMFGVYVGLNVLFGLLLFLLTRGKRNPLRVYTFWETQKMSYWASFAPGILSLCLGFAMQSMAMMSFIFLFGMRIMWMSMKSMRPAQ